MVDRFFKQGRATLRGIREKMQGGIERSEAHPTSVKTSKLQNRSTLSDLIPGESRAGVG